MFVYALRGAPGARELDGAQEALRRLRESGARCVELWFCEPGGRVRRAAFAVDRVDESAFSSGLPIDAVSCGGWGAGAMLVPEPASLRFDPAASPATALFFCDLRRGELRHPLDPRQTLAAAARRLRESGCGDGLEVSISCEFVLTEAGRPARETLVWEHLRELFEAASASGSSIDGFRHGPAEGQGRLVPSPSPCREAADEAAFLRALSDELAARRGLEASFAVFPCAMSVEHVVRLGTANLFYDENGWSRLSPLARWYAGGLVYHAPALAALGGQIAPAELLLSCERSSAACRPASRAGRAASTSLHCRLARASASPHLVVAAQLMAGLDGLDRRVEPRRDEDGAAETITISAEGRVAALDSDRSFLTASGVFSNRLMDAWVRTP